jgi:uncharacterized protein (TIGR02145 family)
MRENLKTTKLNTGEDIPILSENYLWYYAETEAMCYYDNNTTNSVKYGALYNGLAATNDNLCPTGWHVPSNSEWNMLADFLGGANVAGYKMKTAYDWYEGAGDNESGFSALPAGYRELYFNGLGYMTSFWSSTDGIYKTLSYYSNELRTYNNDQNTGYSIRCVKN